MYCFSGLYKSDINEMAAAAQNRYEPHSGGRTLLWANTDYEDNKVGNTEHPLCTKDLWKAFFSVSSLKMKLMDKNGEPAVFLAAPAPDFFSSGSDSGS